jgi:hypothetical protein
MNMAQFATPLAAFVADGWLSCPERAIPRKTT